MNAVVRYGLWLSLALGLSCSPEVGSGEAETSVLGRGDLGWDEDSPEEHTLSEGGLERGRVMVSPEGALPKCGL